MKGVLAGEEVEEVGKSGIFPAGRNEGAVRRFPDNDEGSG
jgi:hypothetical protein